MTKHKPSRLRFNFGFLLEADIGTSRVIELDYPTIEIDPELTLEPLKGTIMPSRVSDGIYIHGKLETTAEIECVRCLEEATILVTLEVDDMFYYPPHTTPEGEFAVGENGFVDLAPLVREQYFLGIPMQPLCKEDCQGLCMECGQNLNERDCGCEEDDIDPRLAALRELLDK